MNNPWDAFGIELDHLVVAAASLEEGSHWLRERLGVPLQPGGRHAGWGTHNRLLQLGAGTYLELIAPDPEQPAPAGPRPFGLDSPELQARLAKRPRLVHFVVRTPRIEDAAHAIGYDPGPVMRMSRGALNWRITVPPDGRPAGGGLLPTLIQRDVDIDTFHPARVLDASGVHLVELRITVPGDLRLLLAGLERDPRVRLASPGDGTPVGLSANVSTPLGRVLVD
jgi:hypothetical protein